MNLKVFKGGIEETLDKHAYVSYKAGNRLGEPHDDTISSFEEFLEDLAYLNEYSKSALLCHDIYQEGDTSVPLMGMARIDRRQNSISFRAPWDEKHCKKYGIEISDAERKEIERRIATDARLVRSIGEDALAYVLTHHPPGSGGGAVYATTSTYASPSSNGEVEQKTPPMVMKTGEDNAELGLVRADWKEFGRRPATI